MSKEQLTEKFAVQFRGYVPAPAGWYLREQNNDGANVYTPIIAWRDCFGDGLLTDGVLLPVLACGVVGRTITEVGGDVMYMPDVWLTSNGNGTFRDRNF